MVSLEAIVERKTTVQILHNKRGERLVLQEKIISTLFLVAQTILHVGVLADLYNMLILDSGEENEMRRERESHTTKS